MKISLAKKAPVLESGTHPDKSLSDTDRITLMSDGGGPFCVEQCLALVAKSGVKNHGLNPSARRVQVSVGTGFVIKC